MAPAEGWERLGELSRLLQSYRHMYVRREVEEDNPSLLNWRHELVEFLKVRAEPGGRTVVCCVAATSYEPPVDYVGKHHVLDHTTDFEGHGTIYEFHQGSFNQRAHRFSNKRVANFAFRRTRRCPAGTRRDCS